MFLGIDTGGTFTDFVFYDGQTTRIHKVLSTPAAPELAILQGIKELGLDQTAMRVIHGSTVATNALLENKGARVVYITNRGLKDVLTIARQSRRELYNLQPEPLTPPVPPELCLETDVRLSASGECITPLTDADIAGLLQQVSELQPESVAINLLYSFLDASYENILASVLPEDLFVSCSSVVLPEQKEYERGIATWMNAYVGPLMQGYLNRLARSLEKAKVSVMRSSGQTCAASHAGEEAVHLMLSGPAGGLSGVRYIGKQCGINRLLTFDMGGTSTDVALIDGDIDLTSQGTIAGYPLAVPMVNMHTIGAGGGSIARVDAGGILLVGPESAGAMPGPACYSQGGKLPTITDANIVLGHLPAFTRLGGRMPLERQAAIKSMEELLKPLGLNTVEEVAEGIVQVANEHMMQALRLISVQRGIDPREFTLAAFGGAGGLHVCALADGLGLDKALAPAQAGVLSALGMIVAAPGRQMSKTLGKTVSECSLDDVEAVLSELAENARNALHAEGVHLEDLDYVATIDVCYQGQAFTLNVPWQDLDSVASSFQHQHRTLFGHTLESPIELVNIRLGVTAPALNFQLHPAPIENKLSIQQTTRIYGIEKPVNVLSRSYLETEKEFSGPLVIMDEISTLFIEPGWRCHMDTSHNLLLEKE